MAQLPSKLYTAAQVRAIDRYLIEVVGIPGYELMCRAGESAFRLLRELWPQTRSVLVVCGGGNNGGDGYVVARLAKNAGLQVAVATIVDPARLKGDAQRAYEDCVKAGVAITAFEPQALARADARINAEIDAEKIATRKIDAKEIDVIVDAIFGTGLDRPLDAAIAACIEAINASGKPVLALDIPSGLHADSGTVMGTAVRATATLSFIGMKLGCFVGEGPKYAGQLHFADLGAADIAATLPDPSV